MVSPILGVALISRLSRPRKSLKIVAAEILHGLKSRSVLMLGCQPSLALASEIPRALYQTRHEFAVEAPEPAQRIVMSGKLPELT